jgi:hypothetical protein
MSVVEDMLCVAGLWVVTSDVSEVFLVSLFQVSAGLAYIRVLTCFTC